MVRALGAELGSRALTAWQDRPGGAARLQEACLG